MLDRIKTEPDCTGFAEFDWHNLSKPERRLIGLYRSLSEREQGQIRRLSEILAVNPEESANT
ncbi:hypothetical protein KVG96_15895 [Pseudomonas sp. COR58]|uniref:Transcriptional regulator n=1 Tax=Pseudomonas ekonensis TaxID=2842353 RepID=A0ABS6PHB8_9PSED|nr:hypothetical protein [Pseudomonas ekonensis]MBV4459437.1 hypothetical protein [Pseudomonas ekonensis]